METAGFRQQTPRSIQFGITNRCNLACAFCSRDLRADSAWTATEAFTVLSQLATAGVLEVAVGGGEPFAFRGFEDLVRRLYDESPLAVHATTNGLLLTPARLAKLRGKLGELRLSIYDDNRWRRTCALLATEGVRFGVNLLVSCPSACPCSRLWSASSWSLGCRDVLLLSYNGDDLARHLSAIQAADLAARVKLLHRAIGSRARLSLDVCWGERMAAVPRHLHRADCGAGRDFVVLTSDKQLMPCSFHHLRLPVRTAGDILDLCARPGRAAPPRPSTLSRMRSFTWGTDWAGRAPGTARF